LVKRALPVYQYEFVLADLQAVARFCVHHTRISYFAALRGRDGAKSQLVWARAQTRSDLAIRSALGARAVARLPSLADSD
jgi:hypothetical protein